MIRPQKRKRARLPSGWTNNVQRGRAAAHVASWFSATISNGQTGENVGSPVPRPIL
jgi:hypothetical protein